MALEDLEVLRVLEVEQFMHSLERRNLQESTRYSYGRDLESFRSWLDGRGEEIMMVEEGTINSYVAHLRKSGRAPSGVARATVSIRSFYKYLTLEGHIKVDPGAAIAVLKVPQGFPKAIDIEKVERLLNTPVGEGPYVLRDRAILETLYGAGLRVSELTALVVDDVDLEDSFLRVFGKGRKERVVPLGGHAKDALAAWMSGAGREVLLERRKRTDQAQRNVFLNKFGNPLSRKGTWAIVRRHGLRAGLGDDLTPHVLRHSCATHMLEAGASIRHVQELLGHSSIRSTQVYTGRREAELKAIYLEKHPRASAHLMEDTF